MSAKKRISQLQATRVGEGIVLSFTSEDGETIELIASEDQADRLVDELEDALSGPDEG